MSFAVSERRDRIDLNCDGTDCRRVASVTATEPSERAFVSKVSGWTMHRVVLRPGTPGVTLVYCPACTLRLPPELRVTDLLSFFPSWLHNGEDAPVHTYDDDAGGPPGECRLCGRLIDAEDIWLAHSPNYPHVPGPYRRFPAHKACWQRVTGEFVAGSLPYRETYRKGW